MKSREVRALSTEDIRTRLEQTYEELFNLKFQAVMGQLEDLNRLTALRRDIARFKTILREREIAQTEGETA